MSGASAAGAAAGLAWLHHTGGYDVAPGGLLTCPLHAATGLWCPFCGGLRSLAALIRGDVGAAASFNVVVLTLLPIVLGWWVVSVRAAWRAEPNGAPRMTNRGWLVLGAVLLAFTVWRNVPALPWSHFLAP
jgi:Protein of unknown function (DUF2752)